MLKCTCNPSTQEAKAGLAASGVPPLLYQNVSFSLTPATLGCSVAAWFVGTILDSASRECLPYPWRLPATVLLQNIQLRTRGSHSLSQDMLKLPRLEASSVSSLLKNNQDEDLPGVVALKERQPRLA